MMRWQWLIRAVAFSGVILLMSWLCSMTYAQSRPDCPRPPAGGCRAQVRTFGYFETTWRQMPGEKRLDIINPRAPGSEVLPTPEGREEVPLPKAPPQLPPDQQPQTSQQMEPMPPQAEGALPLPSGNILPPEGMLLPKDLPTEPGAEQKPSQKSVAPLLEGELPGLPVEPAPAKPSTPLQPAPEKPSTPAKPAQEKPSTSSGKKSSSFFATAPKDAPKLVAEKPAEKTAEKAVTTPLPQQSSWLSQGIKQQAATPVEKPPVCRYTRDDSMISLANGMEPERSDFVHGVHRADSIGVVSGHSANRVEPAGYATAESTTKKTSDLPTAPSVALNGYCPVELSVNSRWALGNLRWTVVYEGWIYRLSGDEQRKQFLADPSRFAPVSSGNDVVLSSVENRTVRGQPAYCATYNGRLYMFSSAATQAEFNRNPERYAAGK